MNKGYFAVITRDTRTGQYEVEFPDLPGCVTVGDTVVEATANAKEAMDLWIEVSADHGDTIPEPTDVAATKAPKGATVVWVPAPPLRKSKAVAISISITERALRSIDTAAAEVGLNRSTFIAHAALTAAGAKATAETIKAKGRKRAKAA